MIVHVRVMDTQPVEDVMCRIIIVFIILYGKSAEGAVVTNKQKVDNIDQSQSDTEIPPRHQIQPTVSPSAPNNDQFNATMLLDEDFIATSAVTVREVTSRDDHVSLNSENNDSEETQKNVIIGIAGAAFLVLLVALSKAHRCCRNIRTQVAPTHPKEEVTQNNTENIDEETNVSVTYDLWEGSPDIRTISGALTTIVHGRSRHNRPFDMRTVSSYRQSFRKFQNRQNPHHIHKEDVLPSYNDAIKPSQPANSDEPPNYGDCIAVQGTSSSTL